MVAENPEPTCYATFINPEPPRGMAVFARIAIELNRKRPDIPLLVVEGRGTADAMGLLPVDLAGKRKRSVSRKGYPGWHQELIAWAFPFVRKTDNWI